jgi:hypothetical protein
MNDLQELVERADRALGPFPRPPDRLERLTGRRRRRGVTRRCAFALLALIVAAAGVGGTVSLLRLARHGGATVRSAGRVSPSLLPTSGHAPPGLTAQGRVDGQTAQQLGRFWFGLTGGDFCLRVMPLSVGPSWTFQDSAHDCVSAHADGPIESGLATGAVSLDGQPGSRLPFTAVYGVLGKRARMVDVVWADHEVSSVAVAGGRFFLVWEGTERPRVLRVRDSAGRIMATADVAAP